MGSGGSLPGSDGHQRRDLGRLPHFLILSFLVCNVESRTTFSYGVTVRVNEIVGSVPGTSSMLK